MMITGIATCKHCGKTVEWYYQIPNRLSDGSFDVERIPEDMIGLSDKPHRIGENRYAMNFWCRNCGYLSDFEYESDRELR